MAKQRRTEAQGKLRQGRKGKRSPLPEEDLPVIEPPHGLLALVEFQRALLELGMLAQAAPLLATAPAGDGHPVLVIPGYLGTDGSTTILRAYLRFLGYDAHAWELGRNRGFHGDLFPRLQARAKHIHEHRRRKLSLIGWSLGGVLAREVARAHPKIVRQVITMGSPFAAHGGSTMARIHRLLTGKLPPHHTPGAATHRAEPPPVPCTAIFSKSDGVTAWRGCREHPGPHTDNIEIFGSHVGLAFNPAVLYAVADRLAQPEGGWGKFDRSGLRRLFYS